MSEEQLDHQFVASLKSIEQQYQSLNKHLQIRIELWVDKLIQYDQNISQKKSRNKYIQLLQTMVQNQNICHPFLKIPPHGDLPPITYHKPSIQIKPPKGDTSLTTPTLNTQRESEIPPSNTHITTSMMILRISKFLEKYNGILKDEEYTELMKQIRGDESMEVYVEEGIERNRKNMFQVRSARGGLNQMEYLKDQFQE